MLAGSTPNSLVPASAVAAIFPMSAAPASLVAEDAALIDLIVLSRLCATVAAFLAALAASLASLFWSLISHLKVVLAKDQGE